MSCQNQHLLHDPSLVQEGDVATLCVHSPDALKAPRKFIEDMYGYHPQAPTDARYLTLNVRWIDQLPYAELAVVLVPVHKKKDSRGEVTQKENYQILARDDSRVGPVGRDHISFLGKMQKNSTGKLWPRPIVVQWWEKPARYGYGISICLRREDGDAELMEQTTSWNSTDWSDARRARVIQPDARYDRMKAISDARYEERFGRRRPHLY